MLTTWPCAVLPGDAPSVADALSAPTAETLTPQLLQLTPRGAAWGTDEGGDGQGASPVQLGFWRGVSGYIADLYQAGFETASQAFPTAITVSLDDWEAELGLPDGCTGNTLTFDGRKAVVRSRIVAQGGASPAYFVCVARAAGYDIEIEEYEPFICGESRCGDRRWRIGHPNMRVFWSVRIGEVDLTWFRAGSGQAGIDPHVRIAAATDLRCILRRIKPVHTEIVFRFGELVTADAVASVSRRGLSADGSIF